MNWKKAFCDGKKVCRVFMLDGVEELFLFGFFVFWLFWNSSFMVINWILCF